MLVNGYVSKIENKENKNKQNKDLKLKYKKLKKYSIIITLTCILETILLSVL